VSREPTELEVVEELDPEKPKVGDSPFKCGYSEVEKVLDTRLRKGVRQYKIKWKGWNNRFNVWRDESELECTSLIEGYNKHNLMYSQGEVSAQVLAVALMMSVAMGAVDGVCPLEGLDVSETVSRLASKQGIEIDPSEFEVGYCTELNHMMNRRLDLVPESEVYLVRSNNSIVPMRMILEAKKDGRRKARLVLQGFREPPEWDTKSNASPVAFPSTVRSLLFKSGSSEDVISSIDVSVAFLQTEEYGPEEAPRRLGMCLINPMQGLGSMYLG
jgi:hypothetical protein